MGRKFGFSFSSKRALGISGAKARVSRKIGVPLTRSGRQRKFGRAAGCCVPIAITIAMTVATAALIAAVAKTHSTEDFNTAARAIANKPTWASEFLALPGCDSEVLDGFSKIKMPTLPANWLKLTSAQQNEARDRVSSEVAAMSLLLYGTDGKPIWCWFTKVKIGGMRIVDSKQVAGGLLVTLGSRASVDSTGTYVKARGYTPEINLFISDEDSQHPLRSLSKGNTSPPRTVYVPIAFSAPDGRHIPTVDIDCVTSTMLVDDVNRFGHLDSICIWAPTGGSTNGWSVSGGAWADNHERRATALPSGAVHKVRLTGASRDGGRRWPGAQCAVTILPAIEDPRTLLLSLGLAVTAPTPHRSSGRSATP